MLLWLAQFFQQDVGSLRVFSFISFRAVFATLTALTIGLIAGPAVIRLLTRLKVGQAVRTDGPQTHLIKSGTPTMGGLLILIAITVSTLLWCDWSNRFIWVVLIVTIGFGIVGWVDDYRKVVYKEPERHVVKGKIFLAVIDRYCGGHLSGVCRIRTVQRGSLDAVYRLGQIGFQYGSVSQGRLHHSFLQNDQLSTGSMGIHCIDLFCHRRNEQCRQSDRRPRRSDDYANHHGRYCTGCFRLPGPAIRFIPNICLSHTFRAQVNYWFFVVQWPGRGWRSCGSTLIRRKCSWAMSARWHWAARWERLP